MEGISAPSVSCQTSVHAGTCAHTEQHQAGISARTGHSSTTQGLLLELKADSKRNGLLLVLPVLPK